jgi:hypothetical protein
MDETNKSSFDFSNLGGLLFGGNDSGLGDYLSETQKKTMQNQALMSAAMSLLKNSGYTTQPISLGQALGSAYEAGTAGYQGAQTNAINQILTKQKLDEAKRAQSALDAYQSFITGQPVEGQAITPQQAISAPGMAAGPTVERANLIGQPMSGATMPSAGTALSPQMQKLLSFLPPDKGIPEAIKLMQPQKTTGQPFKAADGKFYVMTETGGVIESPVSPQVKPTGQPQEAMIAGKPAFVQYYEDGTYKVVSDVAPKTKATGQPFKGADGKFYIQTETGGVIEAPIAPADIAAEEYGQPVPEVFGGQIEMVQYNKKGDRRVVIGAMPYEKPEASPDEVRLLKAANQPITMDNIMALRRSAASQTTNVLNAEKKGTELAYENAMKNLNESRGIAQSANDTLVNVSNILPALDSAILGPGADFRTSLLRIGKQLGMTGADASQVLANTATVVQGLAQQELAAAAQMRGQGAITEPERAILRRVAGGDQSLTAGELRVGLMAAEKLARARIASHQDLLKKATKAIPQLSNIAPMYEITPFGAPQQNPLRDAVQQEIDRRKAAGGKKQ